MRMLMNCSKSLKFFSFLSFWYMYRSQFYFWLISKDCMIFFYSRACLIIWFFIVSLTKTIWTVFFWLFEIVFYLNYQAVWMVFCKLLRWHLLWFLVQHVQFLSCLNVWPDQFFVEQFCLSKFRINWKCICFFNYWFFWWV